MKEFNPQQSIDPYYFKDPSVNDFAFQAVMKRAVRYYEYLVDNTWQKGPISTKPEGKRAIFLSDLDFITARETYYLWTEIGRKFDSKPVFPEKTISYMYMTQLIDRGGNLPIPYVGSFLFIPWGFREEGNFGKKEKRTMNRIDEVRNLMKKRGLDLPVLIMPADYYAIDINGNDPTRVADYFTSVIKESERRGYSVREWSKIKANYQYGYEAYRKKYSDENLKKILSPPVLVGAIDAAGRRSKAKTPKQIEGRAMEYLRERMCEVEVLRDINSMPRAYTAIKLSLAPKNKDNEVDLFMPRLYCMPAELQLPWLGT